MRLIMTTHLQQRMEERGITQAQLHEALQYGKIRDGKQNNTYIVEHRVRKRRYPLRVVVAINGVDSFVLITAYWVNRDKKPAKSGRILSWHASTEVSHEHQR